jgi:hypothetical protein
VNDCADDNIVTSSHLVLRPHFSHDKTIRACARLGIATASISGATFIALYYLLFVPLLQFLSGVKEVQYQSQSCASHRMDTEMPSVYF